MNNAKILTEQMLLNDPENITGLFIADGPMQIHGVHINGDDYVFLKNGAINKDLPIVSSNLKKTTKISEKDGKLQEHTVYYNLKGSVNKSGYKKNSHAIILEESFHQEGILHNEKGYAISKYNLDPNGYYSAYYINGEYLTFQEWKNNHLVIESQKNELKKKMIKAFAS